MRPAMYGSYHQISVLDSHGQIKPMTELQETIMQVRCVNRVMFYSARGRYVVPRLLPQAQVGDYL